LRYHRSDAAATLVLGEQWQVQANDELLIALMDKFGHEAVSLTY
jgi:DNA polymerase-3 subunit alpha